ncbi:MAG: hypothetical protein Q9195_005099 [Heterodermia aff. obscurata]
MAQVLQSELEPTNPQIVTDRIRIGTGTINNYEVTTTTTVLLARQYTKAIRQHHIRTVRLILSRRRFLEHESSRRLLALDDSIRANADQVCDNVERSLMHGAPRTAVVQGATVLMEMSQLLVEGESKMWDASQEVKLRAMDMLFVRGLKWVYGAESGGTVQDV